MLRRLLSTRPLPPAGKAAQANASKASAGMQQAKQEEAAKDESVNPWGHFSAFRSMEDYVDVTLIQYRKDSEEDESDENSKA